MFVDSNDAFFYFFTFEVVNINDLHIIFSSSLL